MLTKNDRRRITKKVERKGDCLIWTGYRGKLGYGYIGYKGKAQLVHRFMYKQFVGEIPEGLVLDHVCRNRACIKISHLEPVTQMENVHRGKVMRRKKTHCANGHEWNVENVRIETTGYLKCRVCDRERQYARYHFQKQEEL